MMLPRSKLLGTVNELINQFKSSESTIQEKVKRGENVDIENLDDNSPNYVELVWLRVVITDYTQCNRMY